MIDKIKIIKQSLNENVKSIDDFYLENNINSDELS
jgi:hypothetical protein